MAYALTAHKCQGETLDNVIIDFGADKKNKIRNYICPGSFYMALTRVREGSKVFLRSFSKSYILANQKIEEKINAMRKFDSYNMKKIYLEERIFENEEKEEKFGYFNINGLLDGNHADYLNEDKNLLNINLLVLAETKLNSSVKTQYLSSILSNWDILERHDANDNSKHMGLLMVAPKKSVRRDKDHFKLLQYKEIKRNN